MRPTPGRRGHAACLLLTYTKTMERGRAVHHHTHWYNSQKSRNTSPQRKDNLFYPQLPQINSVPKNHSHSGFVLSKSKIDNKSCTWAKEYSTFTKSRANRALLGPMNDPRLLYFSILNTYNILQMKNVFHLTWLLLGLGFRRSYERGVRGRGPRPRRLGAVVLQSPRGRGSDRQRAGRSPAR